MVRRGSACPERQRAIHYREIYRNLLSWYELLDSGQMPFPGIIRIPETGEELCLFDMMLGYRSLTDKQRQAFDLVCLLGHSYREASQIVYPGTVAPNQIEALVLRALDRMIDAIDNPWLHRKRRTVHRATDETALAEWLNPHNENLTPPSATRTIQNLADKRKPAFALVPQRNYTMEAEADELLRKPIGHYDDSYLSPETLMLRGRRELHNLTGVADASLYQGMYRRAANDEFGRRCKSNGHHEVNE